LASESEKRIGLRERITHLPNVCLIRLARSKNLRWTRTTPLTANTRTRSEKPLDLWEVQLEQEEQEDVVVVNPEVDLLSRKDPAVLRILKPNQNSKKMNLKLTQWRTKPIRPNL
jgi:hypothetical protein